MLKLFISIILLGGLLLPAVSEAARVRGYYRSNGTYVEPYYRSSPNAYRYDNRSYSGGSLYNRSYSYPTRNYSSSWYTPQYDYWGW